MAAHREITKTHAKVDATAGQKDQGRLLVEPVAVTGWSRANARLAIATRGRRDGRTRAVVRKARARVDEHDTLKVLIEV